MFSAPYSESDPSLNNFQVLVEVCFCVRRCLLTKPLSNQEYGWVAMNSQGSQDGAMRQAFHPTGTTLRLVTECHRNWLPLALRGLIYQCSFAFFLFEIFCLQVHLGSSTLPWRLIDLLSKRQPLSIAFLRSYLTPPWEHWLMTAYGTIRSKDGRWSQDKELLHIQRDECVYFRRKN